MDQHSLCVCMTVRGIWQYIRETKEWYSVNLGSQIVTSLVKSGFLNRLINGHVYLAVIIW